MSQTDEDAKALADLGYQQQLLRDMGGFANFALAFSIISILTGAVTLYGHGLRFGGPLVMSVGWPLVTLVTLAVAASLGELASAYPTAGALYHWASILGGRGWGFTTAWLNSVGQFAISAGIDYGLAEFLAPALGFPGDRAHTLPLFAAVLLSHAVLNHVGVRVVSLLNWFSAWYHIVGVALLVGALVVLAPHQPIQSLFVAASHPGGSYLYFFAVGLLQAAWTFTGYDASAHVTEETINPSRTAPWGIFLSVAVSGVVGWIMLVVVTLSIGDLSATQAAPNPFIYILVGALGQTLGAVLLWIILGAMWFCGLSSITSNSRMLFAFARDGGLPASKLLARVSPRFQSPQVAVWVSAAAAFLVGFWADAYSVMTALSTIALYASYGVPIAVSLLARPRKGPWHLGRASRPIRILALGWIALLQVIFVLPPNQTAGYAFAGCLGFIGVYWLAWARRHFAGPPNLRI